MPKIKPVVGQFYTLVNPMASGMTDRHRGSTCKVVRITPRNVTTHTSAYISYIIVPKHQSVISDTQWVCSVAHFHEAFSPISTVNTLGNFPKKIAEEV
jgi:hypothetical protein